MEKTVDGTKGVSSQEIKVVAERFYHSRFTIAWYQFRENGYDGNPEES